MTVISSLVQLYERMEAANEVPKFGFSSEKISFAVELDADGNARLSDRRSLKEKKKPIPVLMNIPAPPKDRKGRKLVSGYFWDPSPYALGVSIDDEGELSLTTDKADEKWGIFKEHHLAILQDTTDAGLCAFRKFLNKWEPSDFERLDLQIKKEALKTNIVFEFPDEDESSLICQRKSAQTLLPGEGNEEKRLCLITGKTAPIARLHPEFGRISGNKAKIVSFNQNAFDSYEKSQGENAPISERAAFAYGAALDSLLTDRNSSERNRYLKIGDTTMVFWVDTPEVKKSQYTERLMGNALNPPDEAGEQLRLRAALSDVATGRPADPELDPTTRVYLLGLAPNVGRISVRFWHYEQFGDFACNIVNFWEDLHIVGHPDHPPWQGPPAIWSLLYETAIRIGGKAKADTISPRLGGEVMRAVLLGRPLPRNLLISVIRRIRADGNISGRRAAICKAVINRILNFTRTDDNVTLSKKEMIPVSMDTENINPAYRLGRIFAVLERAQLAALGDDLNSTIKDRYFSAASTTPARVFPLLTRNANHHLSSLKKGDKFRLGRHLESQLGMIWLGLGPDLPKFLAIEDQGRFIVGYYHQRWTTTPKQNVTPGDKENDQ